MALLQLIAILNHWMCNIADLIYLLKSQGPARHAGFGNAYFPVIWDYVNMLSSGSFFSFIRGVMDNANEADLVTFMYHYSHWHKPDCMCSH